MNAKKEHDQKVDINFESHPPIGDDLQGIATLLKQTILNFADCNSLASHLIDLKDVTQIIVSEASEETDTDKADGGDDDDDDEDEPDDNIFGVISYVELKEQKELTKFLADKCPKIGELLSESEKKTKVALIINERYINLPPQLSLPTLKNLTEHLDKAQYTHLIFIAKVLLKSKNASNKKRKLNEGSKDSLEPIIYLNPEEEIIFEGCDSHEDVDVSSSCETIDKNYIPNRRIMILEYKNWPNIIKNLEKEL